MSNGLLPFGVSLRHLSYFIFLLECSMVNQSHTPARACLNHLAFFLTRRQEIIVVLIPTALDLAAFARRLPPVCHSHVTPARPSSLQYPSTRTLAVAASTRHGTPLAPTWCSFFSWTLNASCRRLTPLIARRRLPGVLSGRRSCLAWRSSLPQQPLVMIAPHTSYRAVSWPDASRTYANRLAFLLPQMQLPLAVDRHSHLTRRLLLDVWSLPHPSPMHDSASAASYILNRFANASVFAASCDATCSPVPLRRQGTNPLHFLPLQRVLLTAPSAPPRAALCSARPRHYCCPNAAGYSPNPPLAIGCTTSAAPPLTFVSYLHLQY